MTGNMQAALLAAMSSDERLRERVKLIVMRWVVERQVDPVMLREVAKDALEGVGVGLDQRGKAASAALGEAVQGLDEALSRAVYAMQMAAEEAWDGGRQFAATDLQATVDELRGLEGSFIQALRGAADKSQGWLKLELTELGDHLARNGTDTGRRVSEVSEVLARRLRMAAAGSGQAVVANASLIRGRLTVIASGVLRGLADALETKA
jgi:hypothetical protein